VVIAFSRRFPHPQRRASTEGVTVSYLDQKHDFTRPAAPFRKRVYWWSSAYATVVAVGLIVGVGVEWLPMDPEVGIWGCTLFITPVFLAFIVSWMDAPGENRTILEKANEFQMVWFVVAAAASELWWELVWLIGDLAGWMNLDENDRWGWIFWYYGINDTRYLTSDGDLWAMELAAVSGAAIMLYSWFKIRAAGNDPAKRIKPLWWCFFTMSVMLCVFFIYFVAEARHGFPHFPRHHFWDISMVLIYENLPWLIAPIVSLPFVAKQLGYLYRQLPAATEEGALAVATEAPDDVDHLVHV
jgi:hypothetical protein